MKLVNICCGAWTPDGHYFIFEDMNHESDRLWAVREKGEWWRRSPRGPFLLVSGPTGSFSPLVGRDGKHLYFYKAIHKLICTAWTLHPGISRRFFLTRGR